MDPRARNSAAVRAGSRPRFGATDRQRIRPREREQNLRLPRASVTAREWRTSRSPDRLL